MLGTRLGSRLGTNNELIIINLNLYLDLSQKFSHTSQNTFVLIRFEIQVDGKEAKVISSFCNANGIRMLEYSLTDDTVFHYEEATNITFGDQPNIRELNKYYVIHI